MNSPRPLYSAATVRQLDQRVTNALGIASLVLMKRAGRAVFTELRRRWCGTKRIQVFCGGGNNGGDGYVVAGLAAQQQLPVTVYACSDPQELAGDAHLAYQFARQEGVKIVSSLAQMDTADADTVTVDALLGTGFRGPLRERYALAVEHVNKSCGPVLAVDIPSGVESDTGHADAAVQADATVTFIGRKFGLYCGRGAACAGEVVFNALGAPEQVYADAVPLALRYGDTSVPRLPKRARDSYKHQFGHVLVVGGDSGFGGAAVMAAESAARTGAGLVSLATRPQHLPAALTRCPEVMVHPVVSGQELEPLLQGPSVIAVGPGLGRAPWGEQLLARAARAQVPVVLDADALNILAAGRVLAGMRRDDWILTPHVGEAARLIGCDAADVLADPIAAVSAIQHKFSGVVILKGVGTLIAHDKGVDLLNSGNPGMASGGMGDLLTGIIAGLVAQRMSLLQAARLGVWLHGEAGDRAGQDGRRGLLATDLLPWVRRLVD
ncbi:NAD(P)H-hydrate dehydratase [Microbulbifer discodermiae]|uniref:NAD(P)H-hydrate dehydratase n=1 Tax=Microbulbifer sp. 2201CG32-9 TaxID=3232309 RepID=UPI00345BF3F9